MTGLKLDSFIPYRLSVTSNLVSDRIARIYAALFGITIAEWRLIAVIAENPDGLSQQDICMRTRMDKVTVSRAASGLVERGLFHRADNVRDKRSHLLRLSDEGRALYAVVAPKALEMENRIFSGFSSNELATLESMLRRIEDAALEFDGS